MVEIIIGIILILTFFFLVWYCIKSYNLMVGFALMATFWTILALVGNAISPAATMEGKGIIDVLADVFTEGPGGYAKSILVNVFFGAFFGRVLIETGIAATLIRKVVELGGNKPRITMSLLCIVVSIIFMSMTGVGPVISIAVIVLPIMLSLGIPSPVALFSFMGSIMAGIFANIVNFKQFQTIYAGFNPDAVNYTYNDYFTIGMIGLVVTLIVTLVVSNLVLNKTKLKKAWAVAAPAQNNNAPAISWIAVVMPVLGVVLFKLPIILGFLLAGVYAVITTGRMKGGYIDVCRMFAKFFTDGAVDVAPMIGFLLTLAMFNNAAKYAAPYFTAIMGGFIPQTTLLMCVAFAVLAPLGFFRGPMNLVGSGTAILAVVISMLPGAPVAFLYPLFAITTIAPQHLDITQSWVAWGLGYTKVSSKDYMKMSIPTGWIVCIIMCLVVYILQGSVSLI
ncbi:citrate transporter [Ruminococcaceae bacterium OttesenSCG-928-A16]|nr:citrate transporter [Ruminococcaceae bacterium OttesenSCG-928-A16]